MKSSPKNACFSLSMRPYMWTPQSLHAWRLMSAFGSTTLSLSPLAAILTETFLSEQRQPSVPPAKFLPAGFRPLSIAGWMDIAMVASFSRVSGFCARGRLPSMVRFGRHGRERAAAQVVEMPLTHEGHGDRDEQPEHDDHGVDGEIEPDQERVYPQHDQDGDILVEVLHRDRMPGAHEDMAAMLQERVHRHHEEPGQRADGDHQRDGDGDAAHEDHHDDDDTHRDADRHHVDGAVERNEPGGDHGAARDAHRADALQYGRLRQRVAERH